MTCVGAVKLYMIFHDSDETDYKQSTNEKSKSFWIFDHIFNLINFFAGYGDCVPVTIRELTFLFPALAHFSLDGNGNGVVETTLSHTFLRVVIDRWNTVQFTRQVVEATSHDLFASFTVFCGLERHCS